jgi:hypothetical protein
MTGAELTKLSKSIVTNKVLDSYLLHPTFREMMRQTVLLMIGSSNTWDASEAGFNMTVRNLAGEPRTVHIKTLVQQVAPGIQV